MKFIDRGTILVIAVIVLGSVLTGGCTTNVQTGNTSPTIVSVGALLPLTGNAASIGGGINGTLYAAETDVNSYLAATNASIRVHLVVKDTETTPDGALAAMKELQAEGIKAVVGPYSSAELIAIAPYANESGMALLSYGSTVTSLGVTRDNVFRLVPNDSNLGPALAALMRDDGMQVLVPFVRDDIWGNGLINDTRTAFEQQGGVVTEGARFTPNTTNFSAALDAIRPQLTQAIAQYGAGSVGVLFIGFGSETVPMLIAAGNDSQWSSIKWYGTTATPMNLIQNSQAAQLAVRMNFTTAQQAGGQGAQYERLKQKLSVNATAAPEPYGYVASDALWIIAKAYAENNAQNSTALREAIPRIASSYDGLTGNTTLNAVGDRKYANYDFWTADNQNGTYKWVLTAQYRTDPTSGAATVQKVGTTP